MAAPSLNTFVSSACVITPARRGAWVLVRRQLPHREI